MNREETLNLFLNEEYGFLSEESKKPLSYEIAQEKFTNTLHIRKIWMKYKNYKMRAYLYVPLNVKKCKTFIFIMHEYAENLADKDLVNNYQSFYRYCPIDYVTSCGFAVMLVATKEVAPDKKYSHKPSIIKMMGNKKSNNSWGALQAWSWAARKALDYLYSIPSEIDLENVAVIGHSRGGKTALLTAAQDERFIMAVSSCSGNSGAAISRNNTGETIKAITTAFPYWFCKNYRKYKDKEDKLPFDQHQLIGLIAPRYVYVFSATEDTWACPQNELLSCRYASDIFNSEGVNGLITPKEIKTDTSYNEGHIAYHYKTGKHCIEERDWKMIIDFFLKHRK